MTDLDQHFRATRIIAVSLILSLLSYAWIAELIRAQNAPFRGFVVFPQRDALRWILLAFALADAALIPVLRDAILAPRPGAGAPGPRLRTASIVTFALCEAVGLFGFMLFVIGGSPADFYLFLALALVLFAVHFPRRDRWEEWARRATPRP